MTDYLEEKMKEMEEASPAFALWRAVAEWQASTDESMPDKVREGLGDAVGAKSDIGGGWKFLVLDDDDNLAEKREAYMRSLEESLSESQGEEDDEDEDGE